MVWDITKIGQNQPADDQQDGPAELIFIHGGHRSQVNEFDWNLHENGMIASIEDSNIVHLWSMNSSVFDDNEK